MSANPTCPICSDATSRFSHRLRTNDAYGVWICPKCGAGHLEPQPSDEVLSAIYSSTYFLGERTPEGEARVAALKRATAELYFEILQDRISNRSGDLFEIGCGSGDFLLAAQSRGWKVRGLEISPHAAATANARLGQDLVSVGTVEQMPLARAACDVAVFLDVIEHVRDPHFFLQQIHHTLRPGGIAFIVTPSLDSWSAKWMGPNWMEYKVEHLYYFGNRSIKTALEKAGFVDINVRDNPKILSLDYISHHFERFPVPAVTPMVTLTRRLTPRALAFRPIQVVASGMIATARKPI